jgi:hypothetical protein
MISSQTFTLARRIADTPYPRAGAGRASACPQEQPTVSITRLYNHRVCGCTGTLPGTSTSHGAISVVPKLT